VAVRRRIHISKIGPATKGKYLGLFQHGINFIFSIITLIDFPDKSFFAYIFFGVACNMAFL
jgi:hypothetical protein